MRIIRKYPNRRLYDTERSSYITLEGVRQLVMDKVPFQIVDKRTKEDITRSVLLQIISEKEENGSPVFATEVLQQVIRFHGNALQEGLGEFLKMSVDFFVEQQNQLYRKEARTVVDPVAFLGDFTKKNIEFWASLFPADSLLDTDNHKMKEDSQETRDTNNPAKSSKAP